MKNEQMLSIASVLEGMNQNIFRIEIDKTVDEDGNVKYEDTLEVTFNLYYDYAHEDGYLGTLLEKILNIKMIDKEKEFHGQYFILEGKRIYVIDVRSYLFNTKWKPKLRDICLKVVQDEEI